MQNSTYIGTSVVIHIDSSFMLQQNAYPFNTSATCNQHTSRWLLAVVVEQTQPNCKRRRESTHDNMYARALLLLQCTTLTSHYYGTNAAFGTSRRKSWLLTELARIAIAPYYDSPFLYYRLRADLFTIKLG
jgi:hypothetical protein